MQYTAQDIFVGAARDVSNCTPERRDQTIWPKFMVMVLLEGVQHFVIDGVRFRIDAGNRESPAPVVFMLNIAQAGRLRFVSEGDLPLLKVMVSDPVPWLDRLIGSHESMPCMRSFFDRHLAYFSFAPGDHILQLAENILNPPPLLTGELRSMFLKAQGLSIMWQACLKLLADEEDKRKPALMSLMQCQRIRDYIISNLGRDLSIDLIAREVGASSSTVQRNFKTHFGVPIYGFIKQERLEAARIALARHGIPVSQAAHLAGYTSISSFTTAFRKTFGLTPMQARV